MDRKKAKTDIYMMLFFIILSLVLLFWVIPTQIKVTAMMEVESFTPKSFPQLIASGLLLVSVIGFVKSLIVYWKLGARGERETAEKRTAGQWREALFPYVIFALIVIYGLLFKCFGIIPATIIVPPIILWCLRCRKWQMYAIFYAFTAIIYLLFTKILLVPIR